MDFGGVQTSTHDDDPPSDIVTAAGGNLVCGADYATEEPSVAGFDVRHDLFVFPAGPR